MPLLNMKLTPFSIVCLAILVTCSSSLTIPDGHLLVFKDLQIDEKEPPEYYNHASLFKVGFDGTVQEYWNHTLQNPHLLFSDNLFAVDDENGLVYLGVPDQLLALELTTGKVVVKKPLEAPNLLFFWSYDYIAEQNAICGGCTGNRWWNWCRVKLGEPEVKLEFLYQFPGTNELGPFSDIYYIDKRHQSIWYFTGINDAWGVNYTTGQVLFHGNQTLENMCIVHDHQLNRTFTVTNGALTTTLLAELHPWPKTETKLLTLPPDLRTATFGSCDYDQETHTLIVLMASTSNYFYDAMPTQLLFIDMMSLSYKSVGLPGFRRWKGDSLVTAVKYMTNKSSQG